MADQQGIAVRFRARGPARPEPIVPPAPGTFSTSTCCPSFSVRPCATIRARASVGPPAANGTIMETGRSGYASCADAGAHVAKANARVAAVLTAVTILDIVVS
jgi:hypothetical protein